MDRPQGRAENGVAWCIAQRLTDLCHAKRKCTPRTHASRVHEGLEREKVTTVVGAKREGDTASDDDDDDDDDGQEEASNSQRSKPRWHYKIARQRRCAGRREWGWKRRALTRRERRGEVSA